MIMIEDFCSDAHVFIADASFVDNLVLVFFLCWREKQYWRLSPDEGKF